MDSNHTLAMTFESGYVRYARTHLFDEALPLAQGKEKGIVGKVSTSEATTSLVTTIVGAGILGFPAIFAKGGWVCSCILLLLSAWIVIDVGKTMDDAIRIVEARLARNYIFNFTKVQRIEDLAEAAFGKIGQTLTFVLVNSYLLFVGSALMILIGISVNYLFAAVPVRWAIIGAGAVFVPMSLLDNMSIIAKLSVVGVIASVTYAIAIGTAGLQNADQTNPQERVTSLEPQQVSDLGVVLAVMLLGFTYQLVAPTIRTDMEKPTEFPKAVQNAVVVVFLVYGLAGGLGYYGFGDEVKGTVLESMVNPDGSKMIAGIALAGAVIANLVVTFPLLLVCVYRGMEAAFFGSYSAVLRIFLCLLALATGLFLPFFLEILSLIGSVLGVAVGIFCPVVCYWSLALDETKSVEGTPSPTEDIFRMVRHIIIILLGLIVLCVGTYGAVNDLIDATKQGA